MAVRRTERMTMMILTGALGLCSPGASDAAPITLQNATATFSQNGFPVGNSINGILNEPTGWAIEPNEVNQTAVFETSSDVGAVGNTTLTFSMSQLYVVFGQHTIGRVRLSATTDNRSTFADGLPSGGDVTANWTVLSPLSAFSNNGATMTTLGDNSILVGGPTPNTDIYTIIADTALLGITGIRLEVIEDPSLPFNGPGRQPTNGNFVLSEFALDASPTPSQVPEPATLTLVGLGALGLLRRGRRS